MHIRNLFMTLFSVVSICQLSAQKTQEHFVLFASNSSEVTSDEAAALLDLLSEQVYIRNIELHAYTDGDGSEAFNEALSKDRLTSVEAFISKAGYTISSSNFYGEKDPLASNDMEDGKQQNRRVQVRFEADQKILTMASVMETLKPKSQGFCIDNRKDTALVCKNGTIIGIPAGTFDYAECNDCIELRVDEMLTPTDMMLNNVHTLSDGNMLSSGGTVYIQASCNGKRLADQTNKPISYLFPSKEPQDDMSLWTSSGQGEELNWNEEKGVPFSPIIVDPTSMFGTNGEWINGRNEEFTRCGFFCKMLRVVGIDVSKSYSTQNEGYYREGYPSGIASIENNAVQRAAMSEIQRKRNEATSYYSGAIQRLNYINCDAFPNRTVEPIYVNAEEAESGECMVNLAYPKVNGVMQSYTTDGSASFIGSSKQLAIVVAIKVSDNKSYLAIAEKPKGMTNVELEFEELSPVQIRERLKRLDI